KNCFGNANENSFHSRLGLGFRRGKPKFLAKHDHRTYSKRIITYTPRDFEKAQQIVKDLPDKCAGKTVDIASARKLAARNKNKVEREGRIIEPLPHDAIRLYNCRFQDLEKRAEVAPSSVNLVLTDIPYGK